MNSVQAKETKNYVAILDIGSNAVRLVVFDGLNRAPIRIHNERNICNLGAGMSKTGRLNPEGVLRALDSIGRFSGLLAAMRIRNVHAVATAALRDASDGAAFIKTVEDEYGLTIQVIEGDEEARLAAFGVMMNGLGRNGIIGDFGGGSLELIWIDNGKLKKKISLPMGSHRLQSVEGRAAQESFIDGYLDQVDFIKECEGLDFYALGGSWRSIARMHMKMYEHPIKVLDHYTIAGKAAAEYAGLIAQQSLATLEKSEGLSKKRVADVSVASLALARLFRRLKPARLVFSGTGLREGLIYAQLTPHVQRQDALIACCRKMALKISRFDSIRDFGVLLQWLQPLFAKEDPFYLRWIEAACLLSDTAWFEHEDVQALHAFQRTLVLPFYGIDHAGRMFIATVLYVRYGGAIDVASNGGGEVEQAIARVLDPHEAALAVTCGLAMKAAYMMTGGALSLLKDTALILSSGMLKLKLGPAAEAFHAEIVDEAMAELARAIGLHEAVDG